MERGTEVTPFYDPLLAKMIVRGGTRAEAFRPGCAKRLPGTSVAGIETNLDYLRQVAANDSFAAAALPRAS